MKTTKTKFVKVSDPLQVADLIKRGKWRQHLPFWIRTDAGFLWVEDNEVFRNWRETYCTNLAQ